MPLGYYVYYRIEPSRAVRARDLAARLIKGVEAACGVHGRLLTKRNEPHLWMEVYEPVMDAEIFEAAMRSEVQALGFVDVLLPGSARNIECFEG